MFLRNKNTNWQRSKRTRSEKRKSDGRSSVKNSFKKNEQTIDGRKGKNNHQSYWGKGMERNSSRLYFLISLC